MEIDTSNFEKVYPLGLRRLFETCTDSKILGDICRRIGGQTVDLDGATGTLARFVMSRSEARVEFLKRDAARHARYVARKMAEDPEGWRAKERERARRRRHESTGA